jgi:hypothetical protein
LSVTRKPLEGCFIWLCGGPKISVRKADRRLVCKIACVDAVFGLMARWKRLIPQSRKTKDSQSDAVLWPLHSSSVESGEDVPSGEFNLLDCGSVCGTMCRSAVGGTVKQKVGW